MSDETESLPDEADRLPDERPRRSRYQPTLNSPTDTFSPAGAEGKERGKFPM